MRIRIDLKILIFLLLFYFTKQINIYLIIMFFSIIHELGHMLTGLIFKLKVDKLEIMPCGVSVSFKETENMSIKKIELKKILIALAGPATSLFLVVLYTYINTLYISKQDAVYANLLILLFNLIPLYPLDGGRIIKGILNIEIGYEKSQQLTNLIFNFTMIILTLFCSIGVYYFKNIAIFLICIFLWIITIQENNKEKFLETLDFKQKV